MGSTLRGQHLEDTGRIALDADGNAYVAGIYRSQSLSLGEVALTNTGSTASFLCKVSPNGDLLRATSPLSQGAYCWAKDVALGPNGEVMVGLWFTDTLTMEGTNFTSQGGADILLAQFNSDGHFVQGFQFGGTGWDECWGIESGYDLNGLGVAIDATMQNVYSAWAYGPYDTRLGDIQITSQGSNDVLIAKLALSPPPQLPFQHTPGWLHLAWDYADAESLMYLAWTDSLESAANWTSNAEPPTLIGSTNHVSRPVSATQRFYRLSSP